MCMAEVTRSQRWPWRGRHKLFGEARVLRGVARLSFGDDTIFGHAEIFEQTEWRSRLP